MIPANRHVLVIGGSRSGKSAYGERLVLSSGLEPIYLATATVTDEEMAERVTVHRERRGGAWLLKEVPLDLTPAIAAMAGPGRALLVDCLTLWLANLMEAGRDVERETDNLLAALRDAAGPVVFVSNEVGGGIIPDNALARRFRDEHGRLNQRVAGAVGRVVLMVAGLPILLKPTSQPDLSL